jgi:hypothetical protein
VTRGGDAGIVLICPTDDGEPVVAGLKFQKKIPLHLEA